MNKMYAIRIHEHGGPEVLKLEQVPMPILSEGEVLIRVEAIALNHFDILSRKGIYPDLKLPRIIGMDCSGTVVTSKGKNKKLKSGDRVMVLGETLGLGGPGAYAEFVNISEEEIFTIPDNMSFEEAAGIGISWLTAWYTITERANPKKDDWVYIPGGSGGVASAAIQIANLLGLKVISSSRSEMHCEGIKQMTPGVFTVHDKEKNIHLDVKRITGNKGVDLVINAVGGDTVNESLETLKKNRGRIIIIGSAAGRKVDLDIFKFLIHEIEMIGCNFGHLTPKERGDIYEKIKPFFESKQLKVIIDKKFHLRDAASAQIRMEKGDHFGKIILTHR